ncbi:hypothetical protein M011DRAFT_458001 [Sporormia fimetaria CBS 119925]|uniref:Cerato-platanin n=1 Tax=Sporormia fimetaria CBS 119925 TaxID=1340428 RepID=A0A6A6VEW1_9PLEO|nr:hypothetical protein M011DRAFT_458001 [Sporormia fimetaria CBS 119925]
MFSVAAITLSLAALASAAPTAGQWASTSVSVTPHDKFSSSVGVLGCHIDTNRVAYFPYFPSCDSPCIEVSNGERSVYLLHIDQSGGAFDISYDAWNYLQNGQSALENPTIGGGIPASWKRVEADKCAHLIKTDTGKLPLSAANSMGFYAGCGPESWIGQNAELRNIQNSACTLGHDEVCTLDLSVSNQPSCPHQLGIQTELKDRPVKNIDYGTRVESTAV